MDIWSDTVSQLSCCGLLLINGYRYVLVFRSFIIQIIAKPQSEIGGDQVIERFKHGDIEIALIVRRSFRKDGVEFFTPDDYSQQIGYMRRPTGYLIPPHVHNPVAREVHFTREVLIIRSGRLRVDLYTDEQDYVESTVLEAGDIILLASGGHGFEVLEEVEMIEVKQGPYAGDDDKTRFEGIAAAEVVLNSSNK